MLQAPSDLGRKTVLIVEDDPGTRRVLASGLTTTLGMFDVLTAEHGQEAIDVLERRPVDVVVTDLAMPIMDGFALIGALSNRAVAPPVIVLSAMAPNAVAEGLDGYSGLTVLRKPAGYPEVARAVLDALERHALGQVAGIPLASVLQLVEAERRSCTLAVTSGRRRGRLFFESGKLINAFSDDFGADGEAAAYDILTWERTAIVFERLPDTVRRTIEQSTQALLIEVARRQDAVRTTLADAADSIDATAAPAGDADRDPAVDLDAAADLAAATAEAAPAEEALSPVTDPETPIDAPATGGPDAVAADPHRPAGSEPDVPRAGEAVAETAVDDAPATSDGTVPSEPAFDAPLDASAASAEVAVTAAAGAAPTSGETAADRPVVVPAAADEVAARAEPGPEAVDAALDATSGSEPHRDLIDAIERLTRRVVDADAALAAVAEEVVAFREAQRRYDDAAQRQQAQRLAVAEARRDVARLAHQILERMDGLFALEADEPAPPHPGAAPADRP